MSIREEDPTVPTGSSGPARAAAPPAYPQVARPALSSARLTGPAVLATGRTAREASRRRCLTVLLVVLAAVPLVLSLAVSVGAVWIPLGQVWATVVHHLTGIGAGAPPIADQIPWQVRVPRVLLAFVVGAGWRWRARRSRPSCATRSPSRTSWGVSCGSWRVVDGPRPSTPPATPDEAS